MRLAKARGEWPSGGAYPHHIPLMKVKCMSEKRKSELADNSNVEETCYLLWFGRLPKRDELKHLQQKLAEERRLDPAVIEFLRQAPKTALPMDVLRTAVSALSFYDPEDRKNDHDANVHKAIRLTSQIAMIVAAYDRLRKGKNVVEADRALSHAANFLLQLNGTRPSETAERALDIALILHADHELNASTFAARVVAATLSDMHSAVTAAIGALKGPLHGGANEAIFHILGINVDLFTPVFAVSRISGWAAHVIEQLDDNRLIRPRADYIGPAYPQRYVPMERR